MQTIDVTPVPQTTSRTWEVLCHLSALSLWVGVPFGNLLVPLVVWLVKRGDSPSVDHHGKESLNFQLSMTLYMLLAAFLAVGLILTIVGILLLPLLLPVFLIPVVSAILVIIASIKAGNGEDYRYPLTIRFLR